MNFIDTYRMPRIHKSTRSTGQILKGSNHILQSLLAQSRELTSIQKIVDHFVNDDCAVASFKNRDLTLITPTGSLATRIRYRQRNIIAALRRSGLEVRNLKVKVQPLAFRELPPEIDRNLSQQSARQLDELADSIQDNALKGALKRLARHADR
ncbi:MAG: DUF721 domain-containing protein [Pseudomonadales bacterium]|nr:DUF721 domain-containing protein [Pseudomonadales bacterium]MBO6822175.1 DUF721 domain-containing protein [Pseudomonadales bacterium]